VQHKQCRVLTFELEDVRATLAGILSQVEGFGDDLVALAGGLHKVLFALAEQFVGTLLDMEIGEATSAHNLDIEVSIAIDLVVLAYIRLKRHLLKGIQMYLLDIVATCRILDRKLTVFLRLYRKTHVQGRVTLYLQLLHFLLQGFDGKDVFATAEDVV
jgi:hypothetical protein